MRSQIILALLATAISAAPVLTTGEAKISQLSRREAEPGLIIDTGDASEESPSKRSPGASVEPFCQLADGTVGKIVEGEDGTFTCVF